MLLEWFFGVLAALALAGAVAALQDVDSQKAPDPHVRTCWHAL
jgi:hypothetical protein